MRLHAALVFLAVLAPDRAFAGACGVLDKFKTGASQEAPYRPLPVLAPDKEGGTLDLAIRLRRFGGPGDAGRTLMIGSYPVGDVPVFEITPRGATRAWVVDPLSNQPVPLTPDCLQDPSWIFGGTRWELMQGDRVSIRLESALDYDKKSAAGVLKLPQNGSVPCRATNLHTHGFLVPPTQPADPAAGLYGDYALDVTQPSGSRNADSDDCGDPIVSHAGHRVLSSPMQYGITIPGKPHQNGLGTGEHPSGLFWYHPHPHGFSRMQTGGGTTGLITVGDLGDYACKENPRGRRCPAASAPSQVRYLELKDAQLSSKPAGGVYSLLPEYTSGACGARASGDQRRGQCLFDDKTGIWVFTVNGVQYPVIQDGKPDVDEVWRIANVSANVTYLLQLQDKENRSQLKPFRLLALDGVSVAQSPGSPVRESTRLLLMPGSRAEVWVTPESGKAYVLNTAEIKTGVADSGDDWPDVDLAEVRWPEPLNQIINRGPALAVPGVHVTGPQDASLPVGAAAALVGGQKQKAPAKPAVAPACRLDPGDERHIYMVKREDPREIFGLLAGIRRANGALEFFDAAGQVAARSVADAWNRIGGPKAPLPGPAFGANAFANICGVQGRTETWVIENWTGECHNFHIHQSRFRLDSTKEHLGNPNYFAYPRVKSGEAPVVLLDSMIEDMTAAPAGGRPMSMWRDAYHDSVPVPRGESKCAANPSQAACKSLKPADQQCHGDPGGALCSAGKVTIQIGFLRTEQVGNFVYHCHILEHEDGGMMGELRVCAKDDMACLGYTAAHHQGSATAESSGLR
jgi:FtsP/CotA-like multicopper oxidase with cupredoxin domain